MFIQLAGFVPWKQSITFLGGILFHWVKMVTDTTSDVTNHKNCQKPE